MIATYSYFEQVSSLIDRVGLIMIQFASTGPVDIG